ncbi:LysR family transcriptional regulator [Vibrio variabilis]|uniref:LysR family transcriptional regulator n=1 Tax=Vibrio variabilis TaxID=990271 RepID=A0ABR4YAK9_9VIBR|nr:MULTISPECIES: LysR family transcriptional regulator [Vibrio]EED27308.1 transcriptional regulator, substrate-binding of LysR family protein [Vibrio sp. 16]KHA60350.1 LysR family transcriptional regulator [Vibrio variabilis]KIE22300.1 LysR family transcriptional regulator [Vibrio sinaloensis]CAK4066833.1 HTH-type transcriptional regulator GltC [Vibrio sp. 16]
MDLKRLHYFNQLAKTGNFTKAADQLGIAQSALSTSIKKLEQQLGLKLVNRTERQMSLTAEGQVLLRHAKIILEDVEQAEKELQELKGLTSGVIKFGAPAMLASYFLPDALEQFKKAYPGIQINIHEAGTATLAQMLVNGELDLALIRGDREHEQIRQSLLAQDQIAACVPISHPFAKRSAITLDEFCQQPLVLFKNGYFLRETVNSYCQQNKLTPQVHFETNLPELLKSMVRRQVGIGTCLPILVADDPELKAIPFDPPIPLQLGIGWKSSHYLSTAAKAFVDFLQGTLKQSDTEKV